MSAHEDLSRKNERKGSSDRSFGVVFAVFFALIAFWPLLKGHPLRLWAAPVSAIFLFLALIRPSILHPLNLIWMTIGMLLNQVTNPIVTGAMFYGVITPVGVILRLRGKDPLRMRTDPTSDTYWLHRKPPGPAPETMVHQF